MFLPWRRRSLVGPARISSHWSSNRVGSDDFDPSIDPDAGESEQVGDREFAVLASPELSGLGVPRLLRVEVRGRVRAEETDEPLGHDSSARRTEPTSATDLLGLLQDV